MGPFLLSGERGKAVGGSKKEARFFFTIVLCLFFKGLVKFWGAAKICGGRHTGTFRHCQARAELYVYSVQRFPQRSNVAVVVVSFNM